MEGFLSFHHGAPPLVRTSPPVACSVREGRYHGEGQPRQRSAPGEGEGRRAGVERAIAPGGERLAGRWNQSRGRVAEEKQRRGSGVREWSRGPTEVGVRRKK